MIATRFHGTILALDAGRPVLPVIYSDKTRHVLEDLGFQGTILDLREDSELVAPFVETRWTLPKNIREEAQQHFLVLDQILCE